MEEGHVKYLVSRYFTTVSISEIRFQCILPSTGHLTFLLCPLPFFPLPFLAPHFPSSLPPWSSYRVSYPTLLSLLLLPFFMSSFLFPPLKFSCGVSWLLWASLAWCEKVHHSRRCLSQFQTGTLQFLSVTCWTNLYLYQAWALSWNSWNWS